MEEFYQDFFRLYKRPRKKARVVIKLEKKYAEGKLKYLPNDKKKCKDMVNCKRAEHNARANCT